MTTSPYDHGYDDAAAMTDLPEESAHAYLIGKWATIDGTLCFVREVLIDGDDEILNVHVHEGSTEAVLIGSQIREVSA